MQSGRHHGLLPGRRSGLNQTLVEKVLELRPPDFVAGGVSVRQVVGDVVDVDLLGGHTAGGAIQSSNHFASRD